VVHFPREDLEAAIHEGMDDLRIQSLRQGAEPHHIGKQHRDLLSFPFEGCA